MRIKETYIVYDKFRSGFVKLHYCVDESGASYKYYCELNHGKIFPLTGTEFYNLLNEDKS